MTISKAALKAQGANVCIHTPTQEDWDKVIKEFSLEIVRSGWGAYEGDCTIYPGDRDGKGTYGSMGYAKENAKTVYKMSDIEWDDDRPTMYKLIKRYPKSPELGTMLRCEYNDRGQLSSVYDDTNTPFGTDWVKGEYAEFWEPVYDEQFEEGDWIVVVEDMMGCTTRGSMLGKTAQILELNKRDGNFSGNSDYFCRLRGDTGGPGTVVAKVRHATEEEIEAEKDRRYPKVGAYRPEIKDGRLIFGCQSFTRDEVQFLYRIVRGEEIKADVTIYGTKITRELLSTFIAQM